MSLIISLVPLVVGLVLAYYSYDLSLGTLSAPGAGLWPFILSSIMVVTAVYMLIFQRDSKDYQGFTPRVKQVLYAVLSIFVFIFLMDKIGVMFSIALLMIFWLKFLGQVPWKMTGFVTALILVFVYVVFIMAINIPFPEASWLGR